MRHINDLLSAHDFDRQTRRMAMDAEMKRDESGKFATGGSGGAAGGAETRNATKAQQDVHNQLSAQGYKHVKEITATTIPGREHISTHHYQNGQGGSLLVNQYGKVSAGPRHQGQVPANGKVPGAKYAIPKMSLKAGPTALALKQKMGW